MVVVVVAVVVVSCVAWVFCLLCWLVLIWFDLVWLVLVSSFLSLGNERSAYIFSQKMKTLLRKQSLPSRSQNRFQPGWKRGFHFSVCTKDVIWSLVSSFCLK